MRIGSMMFGGALGLALASAAVGQSVAPAVTPQARAAMADFGRCVARTSPAKAREVLIRDFRTNEYRRGLRVLAADNAGCFRQGKMRSGGLPFAAAIAEALIKQGTAPLNARLVRAGSTDAPTFGPSDKVAMCVARSDGNGAAKLFAAPIASPAEAAAAAALGLAVRRCTPAGVAVELGPFALRSILATASYRLLEAAE